MVQNYQVAQHLWANDCGYVSAMIVTMREALFEDPRADPIIYLLDQEYHVSKGFKIRLEYLGAGCSD